MEIYLWFCFLLFHVYYVSASLRCRCEKARCVTPVGCKVGVVPDMCNCCKICAQSEGELCGGIHHVEGQCGEGLQCMVRDLRNIRNRKKRRVEELVGRCEKQQCHTKRCPYGQICSMNNGIASCMCPTCENALNEPVCGEANNRQYANECELRKDECEQGKQIGLINGRCRGGNLTHIECSEDSMSIVVAKTFFNHKRNRKFSLFGAECVLQENSTHVFYKTKLNECGTKPTYTLTSVVYSNVIRTYTDPKSTIIRHKTIQLPFECEYSLRSRNRIQIASKGEFGNRLEDKLRSNGVGIRIREIKKTPLRSYRSTDYNIKVDVNHVEKYLVELKARSLSKISNGIVYPKRCYVTPVLRSQRWMKYNFLENGCPTENGVEILDSISPVIRLQLPRITFRGSKYPGVLVRCRIGVCVSSDVSKCKKQCENLTTNYESLNIDNNDVNNKRKRRSVTREDEDLMIDSLILFGKPIRVH